MNPEVDYLGDGVYVEFDGFSFILKANDYQNPTDQIVLEPSVLDALNRFRERMKELYMPKSK